ncbi:MAG: hypothetical protein U1F43_28620 [Myxococcota bacterium]
MTRAQLDVDAGVGVDTAADGRRERQARGVGLRLERGGGVDRGRRVVRRGRVDVALVLATGAGREDGEPLGVEARPGLDVRLADERGAALGQDGLPGEDVAVLDLAGEVGRRDDGGRGRGRGDDAAREGRAHALPGRDLLGRLEGGLVGVAVGDGRRVGRERRVRVVALGDLAHEAHALLAGRGAGAARRAVRERAGVDARVVRAERLVRLGGGVDHIGEVLDPELADDAARVVPGAEPDEERRVERLGVEVELGAQRDGVPDVELGRAVRRLDRELEQVEARHRGAILGLGVARALAEVVERAGRGGGRRVLGAGRDGDREGQRRKGWQGRDGERRKRGRSRDDQRREAGAELHGCPR